MKKFLGLTIVLLIAAPAAMAAVGGSPHDFSTRTWGSNQICVFCHTPHNAPSALVPLWNHATTTTATFTIYTSNTLNAAMGQPAGTSKACLSCHDGSVAIDSYGTRTGNNIISGAALVGTDLSNDHPVSFTYDSALAIADGGLVSPASASLVSAGVPLFGAKVECASCHNVHDNGLGDFLRVSNASSALCLKCHTK